MTRSSQQQEGHNSKQSGEDRTRTSDQDKRLADQGNGGPDGSEQPRLDSGREEEMTLNELVKIKDQIERLQKRHEEEHDLSQTERDYREIRKEFEGTDRDRHRIAAEKAVALLQRLIGSIVKENHFLLTSGEDGRDRREDSADSGATEDVMSFSDAYSRAYKSARDLMGTASQDPAVRLPLNWPLVTLCELLDDMLGFSLGDILEGPYKRHEVLLKSFRWTSVSQLCDALQRTGAIVNPAGFAAGADTGPINDPAISASAESNEAKEYDTRDLEMQQILCSIAALMRVHKDLRVTPYYLLPNFQAITDEINRIREGHTKVSGIDSRYSYLRPSSTKIGVRPFEWIKFRGMLINASDSSRNISFKVESMVRVFDTIYKAITTWCEPNEEGRRALAFAGGQHAGVVVAKDSVSAGIKKLAGQILFEAGYASGSRFGWTMHEIFQKQPRELDLADKIRKWCDFDSDVGFGLLELPEGSLEASRISYDGQPITGDETLVSDRVLTKYSIRIQLANNFLTYRRETSQVNLCGFMCGYIQGILEKISGQPYTVSHGAENCEQYLPELDRCTFFVSTDVEKLHSDLEEARERVPDDYQHRRLSSVEQEEGFRSLVDDQGSRDKDASERR